VFLEVEDDSSATWAAAGDVGQAPSSNQNPKCLPAQAQLVFFSIFVGPMANPKETLSLLLLLLLSSKTTPCGQRLAPGLDAVMADGTGGGG